MPEAVLQELASLLTERGNGLYGLADVLQVEHALQAAWLAEQDGHAPALITASLLHDIGHLVHDLGEDPAAEGVDDRHEDIGHDYLTPIFGSEVTEPIRLHVSAKRYLCGAEADYLAKLSADSVRSLALQGGAMNVAAQLEFLCQPYAREAILLRRYDERAKVKGLRTPPVAHFMPYVARCLRPNFER